MQAVVWGVLTALGFEKYGYTLLSVVGCAGFLATLWHLRHEDLKKNLCFIFFYFSSFLSTGLHWFAYSTHVQIETLWWVIPFAALGLPMFLSVFYLPLGLVAKVMRNQRCSPFLIGLILYISFADYLRSHVLTGLPWLLFGQVGGEKTLTFYSALYSTGGVHFAGLYLLFTSFCLSLIFLQRFNSVFKAMRSLCVLALIIFVPGFVMKNQKAPDFIHDPRSHMVNIVMVQPDIPQKLKWGADAVYRNVKTMIDLSKGVQLENTQNTIYVWPETSLPPIRPSDESRFLENITRFMKHGDLLITGAYNYQDTNGNESSSNSVYFLNAKGEKIAVYNKIHLVPFGEYVPLRQALGKIIAPIVHTQGDFTPGTLEAAESQDPRVNPFLPLVCYEAIFGDEVRAQVLSRPRARVLINVTNDGWFLNSSGPYQHLHIAKIRAVELGMPLVRVAWRGITCYTNPGGGQSHTIGYGSKGAVLVKVKTIPQETIYKSFGELVYYFCFGSLFLCMLVLIMFDKLLRTPHEKRLHF